MEDCILKGLPWFSEENKSITFCKPDQQDFQQVVKCQEHILRQRYASYHRAVMLVDSDLAQVENENISEYYSTILDLGSQTTYVCLEDFVKFLETNLSKPKTALAVFRENFDYYWSFISDLSRGGTKFGHNLGSNDSLLKKPKGFYISNTGDECYNLVHKRMSVLLHSGIYWYWEKLEQMQNDNFDRTLKTSSEPVKALQVMDFELVFLGSLWLLTSASVFVTFEITV
ncbi:unnamed protein product [Allacma fusca]|uniref:Uncharacterized protein n=1 Tax=Allacma fusca TaxID=39272 RepID=A0A8J2PCL6_9HEXA|nr:unnamed protein product [Allacma fusca]